MLRDDGRQVQRSATGRRCDVAELGPGRLAPVVWGLAREPGWARQSRGLRRPGPVPASNRASRRSTVRMASARSAPVEPERLLPRVERVVDPLAELRGRRRSASRPRGGGRRDRATG